MLLHEDSGDWSVCSESALGAQVVLLVLSCCSSNIITMSVVMV